MWSIDSYILAFLELGLALCIISGLCTMMRYVILGGHL